MLKYTLAASAAVAAVLALSVPGYAAVTNGTPAVATVTVNGTVAPQCSLGGGLNPGATTITLTNNIDPTGAAGTPQTVNFLGDVWCNGTSNTVGVTAHQLTTSGTAGTGFSNTVDYTLAMTTPLSGSVDTAGHGSSGVTASEGGLPAFDYSNGGSGTITVDAQSNKPIAGNYTGSITVTLTPGT